MLMSRPHARFLAAISVLVGISCGGGGDGTAPLVLTSISVVVSPASVQVGQTAGATATGADQNGAPITLPGIAWSTSNTGIATVTSSGSVTAVGVGTVQIIATSSGKVGQASLTVTAAAVASVRVTPATVRVAPGSTSQLSAATLDAAGNTLTGRTVVWSTSDAAIATVTDAGLVSGVAPGTATITATSEGATGSAAVTIGPVIQCTTTNSLKLGLGETRAISAGDAATLCVGGVTSVTEYVLIPFNNSPVAASTTPFQLESTNTIVVQTTPNQGVIDAGRLALQGSPAPDPRLSEAEFRMRALRDIQSPRARRQVTRSSASTIPGNLTVGTVIQLNSSLNGNICTSPRVNHPARLVAQLTHTMVFIDTLSPPGGYTDAELTGFAQAFDTLAYAVDTLNFGLETDIDNNVRVAIFFTPGINSIPAPAGGFIGGLFAPRDLFSNSPTTGCIASNQGEMFYLPVPDPQSTINNNYTSKTLLARIAVSTLAHEFQHLINAGRRIYVNDADDFEEVWLNEGLSHIAEELLYYRISGHAPRSNLTLPMVAATQPLVDAFNANMTQNFGRLRFYMMAPSSNSPYSAVDALETRGATWQFLRYSADRTGGNERDLWFGLVNSRSRGAVNFATVLGDLVPFARDWSVAQFADDIGLSPPSKYTNPSWSFRSVMPALNNQQFPLATLPLIGGSPLSLQLVGGGAAYVRFRILSNALATIAATSSGQPLSANIDFVLVRTQ